VNNSLIMGGTGMLREASRWLIARSDSTLLVARGASRMDYGSGTVSALDADWSRPDFEPRVRAALAEIPEIRTALLWLHDPESILTWLVPLLPGAQIVVVLGSTDGRPEQLRHLAHVNFVQLGSVEEGSGRRWLTHAEISVGAISAINDRTSVVVGQLVGLSGR